MTKHHVKTLDLDLTCSHCGYNLRGLPGNPVRCPECGTEHELEKLLFAPDREEKRRRRLEIIAALSGLCAGLCVVCGVAAWLGWSFSWVVVMALAAIFVIGAALFGRLAGAVSGKWRVLLVLQIWWAVVACIWALVVVPLSMWLVRVLAAIHIQAPIAIPLALLSISVAFSLLLCWGPIARSYERCHNALGALVRAGELSE